VHSGWQACVCCAQAVFAGARCAALPCDQEGVAVQWCLDVSEQARTWVPIVGHLMIVLHTVNLCSQIAYLSVTALHFLVDAVSSLNIKC
jgi:hypothetical protein